MKTPIQTWTVRDAPTGHTFDVTLASRRRRGRKPKAKTIHDRLVKGIVNRAPRGSVRLIVDGRETSVHAAKQATEPIAENVERHHRLLLKRGHPIAAELIPPSGQAAYWYEDVIQCVPRSGREVARQVARLCGNDSQLTLSIRSLADAVGRRDRSGRLVAFTERGIETLIEAGWLRVETVGEKAGAQTTFYLLSGDRWTEWFPDAEDDWLDEQALGE